MVTAPCRLVKQHADIDVSVSCRDVTLLATFLVELSLVDYSSLRVSQVNTKVALATAPLRCSSAAHCWFLSTGSC
jgi:hypothetical protein